MLINLEVIREIAEDIANRGRNSISDFCINNCQAKCCKFGALLLQSNSEVNIIVGNKKEEFLKNKILEPTVQGNFKFNYEGGGQCRHLNSQNLCGIHKNPSRPRICSDFPIFLFKNNFTIADNFCPAAQSGLLENFAIELETLGLRRI